MTFGSDLEKFRKKTTEKIIIVKRTASFDLFSSIVISTPVDKGVLRNNWFVSIGRPNLTTNPEDDATSEQQVLERMRSILQDTTLAADIVFTNNLPYAVPIEFDGHSWRRPEGMVRVNSVRWDTIVKNVTRNLK